VAEHSVLSGSNVEFSGAVFRVRWNLVLCISCHACGSMAGRLGAALENKPSLPEEKSESQHLNKTPTCWALLAKLTLDTAGRWRSSDESRPCGFDGNQLVFSLHNSPCTTSVMSVRAIVRYTPTPCCVSYSFDRIRMSGHSNLSNSRVEYRWNVVAGFA